MRKVVREGRAISLLRGFEKLFEHQVIINCLESLLIRISFSLLQHLHFDWNYPLGFGGLESFLFDLGVISQIMG